MGYGADGAGFAVEARAVTVEYERSRGKGNLVALDDFSVGIKEGEFLTIVGPAGAARAPSSIWSPGCGFPRRASYSSAGNP